MFLPRSPKLRIPFIVTLCLGGWQDHRSALMEIAAMNRRTAEISRQELQCIGNWRHMRCPDGFSKFLLISLNLQLILPGVNILSIIDCFGAFFYSAWLESREHLNLSSHWHTSLRSYQLNYPFYWADHLKETACPASGTRPHRKRKITQVLNDSRVCAGETEVDDCDLLRCGACKQVVSDFKRSHKYLTQYFYWSTTWHAVASLKSKREGGFAGCKKSGSGPVIEQFQGASAVEQKKWPN